MGKIRDLTGQTFGELTVISCAGKLDGRRYFWNCKCSCGQEKVIPGASLTSGNTKSCGHLRFSGIKKYNAQQSELAKIPIGTKIGKLTVLEDLGMREQVPGHNRRWYRCQCECGRIHDVMANTLKQGHVLSCGHCIISKGEYFISKLLDENNIIYNHEVRLPSLEQETGRKLRFDFVLYDQNGNITRIIEFDGRQHLTGPDTTYWGHSIDTLESIKEKDQIKNNFCHNHNIPLIRIPYNYINKITLDTLLGDMFLVKKGE